MKFEGPESRTSLSLIQNSFQNVCCCYVFQQQGAPGTSIQSGAGRETCSDAGQECKALVKKVTKKKGFGEVSRDLR